MKTSRVPLTALAALVTLTLAGMSASALAATTPIQTDIGMHNEDNDCALTVTPPASRAFNATFTANLSADTRSMTVDTVGPATSAVAVTGNAACTLTKVSVTQQSTSLKLLNKSAAGVINTANGGHLPVIIFISRALSYKDESATIPVGTAAYNSPTASNVMNESDAVRYAAGSADVPAGAGGTQTSLTAYNPLPSFAVTADVYFPRPNYKVCSVLTAYDLQMPMCNSGNASAADLVVTLTPDQSQGAVRLMNIDFGVAFGTRPYGADNKPDDSTVYDAEVLTAQSVISITAA
ncbi:hypothetical protein ENT52713_46230 [Enterobacter sp. 200527-13]|uniref:hypothetical protein n=1 Tax=Enterobacter sp. 200527-13 TaxID=2995131 RepID=UPI0022C586F2|nr:hypothetical protein [Enterobacter sp. 200527-13]GLH27227.1 hypothetical protein ENT52713_46230 [Enterobacter sp. 200527-13]